MKGIILRDHEVRRLASAGSVLIWRRVKLLGAYSPAELEVFQVKEDNQDGLVMIYGPEYDRAMFRARCPHGSTGETRFVKETGYWIRDGGDGNPCVAYRAENVMKPHGCSWRSPAQMPSWASRFRVTLSVSCRQIQSVTEEEAIDGGCDEAHLEHTEDCESEHCALAGGVDDCCGYLISSRLHLKSLIESRNPGSWNLNSWFWAIEAKEVK